MVVVLAVLGSLSALAGLREGDTVVETGPIYEPAGPPTTGAARPSRVQAAVPSGWETLFAEGDRLVVPPGKLEERDLRLALLARDDAPSEPSRRTRSFWSWAETAWWPSTPLGEISRSTSAGAEMVQGGVVGGPGPEYALGDEKVLARGVRVRRGDVPRSGVLLASYAGPTAPAARRADAVLGSDGWALVVTSGRPYLREVYDGGGRLVGEAVVS